MDEITCCPKFDPDPWEDKMMEWSDKKFIKEKVRTFFFMPLNFGSVMKRLDEKVTAAGGTFAHSLCLSDHTSRWNMDVYLAVDREIPGAENTTLTGSFMTKVYEGPFRDTGKWCADFSARAKDKGLEVRKWYMWYTTCPKCAKKYGKNYTVIVGQVK
ncbi:MAG TPA: hypothetical protein PLN61_03540 [bacterium]|nr:hypothetical protein [bacterium]HQI47713.1 hypothetical protein [bacterium]HQJ64074.1 hypothetical protein [bacterium]